MSSPCAQCQSRTSEASMYRYEVVVGSRTFEREIPAIRCTQCGEVWFEIRDAMPVVREAVAIVTEQGPFAAPEFGFLCRKTALNADELASLVGVTSAELLAMREGAASIDVRTWFAVAELATDRMTGSGHARQRLERFRDAAKAPQRATG